MRVLLIKAEKDVADILTLFLEGQYHFEVARAQGLSDAMEHLLEDKAVDLIICDDNDQNLKIFKYILSIDAKIPAILLRPPGVPAVLAFPDIVIGSLTQARATDELKKLIDGAIQIGKLREGVNDSEYCRVATKLLTRVMPLKSDIFIRLSNVKYVKLFNQGDSIQAQDLESYLAKKKIEYLYLRKTESAEFVERFRDELIQSANSDKTTPEAAQAMASSVHEAVMELGGQLGFTPEVQEIAKNGVKLTLKSIGSSPRLSKVLSILTRDKSKYITGHSVYLAQVACSFSVAMDWPSTTTFHKLSCAAFFHDFVFLNQALAQVDSLAELEAKAGQFTEAEKESFRTHPMVVADIVKRFSEIPSDVDTIIIQHHERPDGSGFPRKLTSSYINPLSALFILAHEFIDFVYAGKEGGVEEFLRISKDKYTSGTFKKIVDALSKNKERIVGA